MKLYTWNWTGGGYNSCRAESKEAATAVAKEMAEGYPFDLLEGSVREVSTQEMIDIDRSYASMFD